ncbi:MAG: 16S rRNA (uracil(1498)-N(3))-methyltransferase [Lentisphaerae bacterium]|nr:16S rRNA (uracil(1498)-N(3))-methyltransferase [Lentisphaerota bacterium]
MLRQFMDTPRLLADGCVLDRDESHHLIRVLRVTPGDGVEGFDGAGLIRPLRVARVARNEVGLEPAGVAVARPKPACAITLFVCISKGNRMDWTVEKAVETGASRIVPVLSARTVVRLDAQEGLDKRLRWERVAREAARQCGAAWVPQIEAPLACDASTALVAESAPVLIGALRPNTPLLREALEAFPERPAHAGWFVGPEGDFTTDELDRLIAAGAIPVALGGLVLRAETAALYGLCVIGSRWL